MDASRHLVMIHGLLGSIDYFLPSDRIGDITVHTPDLLGYGRRQADAGTGTLTLDRQARHVIAYVRERVGKPVWLLGHSVGGAVAMLAARLEPSLIRGVISVEGNFTLNDAFWCRKIGAMSAEDWAVEYADMQSDPERWLRNGGIEPTAERIGWAAAILQNQPHATVRSMAHAVVTETAVPEFLQQVRSVIDSGMPVALLAGETSAAEWDVPDWVRASAKEHAIQRGTGHMMMLEAPAEFCRIVRTLVDSLDGAVPAERR